MLAIGHRGAAGHAPENTLKSISKALELGADWIEIDVYLVDSQLIVFHDDRLERTTNGEGYISEKSFEYLRSLDAGEGEKIPTLTEVFNLVDKKAGINIELKGKDTAQAVVRFTNDRIANGWSYEKIVISCFDHTELAKVKDLNPKILTAGLLYGIPLEHAEFGEKLKLFAVNPSIDFINQRLVDDAHARGFQVWAYTANELSDIDKMQKLGVDGVFSDFPERVKGKRR